MSGKTLRNSASNGIISEEDAAIVSAAMSSLTDDKFMEACASSPTMEDVCADNDVSSTRQASVVEFRTTGRSPSPASIKDARDMTINEIIVYSATLNDTAFREFVADEIIHAVISHSELPGVRLRNLENPNRTKTPLYSAKTQRGSLPAMSPAKSRAASANADHLERVFSGVELWNDIPTDAKTLSMFPEQDVIALSRVDPVVMRTVNSPNYKMLVGSNKMLINKSASVPRLRSAHRPVDHLARELCARCAELNAGSISPRSVTIADQPTFIDRSIAASPAVTMRGTSPRSSAAQPAGSVASARGASPRSSAAQPAGTVASARGTTVNGSPRGSAPRTAGSAASARGASQASPTTSGSLAAAALGTAVLGTAALGTAVLGTAALGTVPGSPRSARVSPRTAASNNSGSWVERGTTPPRGSAASVRSVL